MKSGSKKLTFAFLLSTAAILVGCIGGIVAVSRKNNRRNSIGDVGSEIDPERYNALSDKDKALVDKILAQEEYIESLLSQADELVPIEDAAATKDEIDDEMLNTVPSSRGLQGTATYLTPLACNSGIDFNTLPCTSLSSLLPAAGNLQIPCGTCVQVDITDGSTVELPGGLLISGMLHFPPSANVHIRITSVLVEGTLKIEAPTLGNQVKFSLFGVDNVMYTSAEIGSKCEGGCNLGFKPIAVVGGNLDIKGYADGCPSWEKLIYASPVNTNELYVSGPAAACWGPGTELVLTSHTRIMDDRQVVTVQSTDPSTGQIVLMEPITKTISLVDNADFAVEIASLNRPVVFEGEPNGVFGGHLIVFHTQTPQHIEGVEIRNFGQQGLLGRYPLHFHKCDDSPHSIVKKNVVRNSNQRGYVIHGTNQVTIEDNVAFEVVGHCYFLEDASEEGNTFSGNLGLSVRNMPATGVSLLKQQTSTTITSDDSAAVFWISNPRNIFLNNVAAGSERFGFWFECRGETMTMTVTAFVNNEIHSTLGFGFTTYEPGWRPTQTAYFHNLKVYRTNGDGAFLHVAENLVFIGGLFADTGSKSVFNSRGDSVLFEGTKFIGFSGTAEPYILCTLGPKNIMGMLIDGTKMNEFDYAGMFVGTILRNVEFSHWSAAETGCGSGTTPFQVSTKQAFWPAFYNPHYFDNVNIIGDASTLRACEAIDFGINSVAIEIVSDTNASFSPAASPGFLVSSKISELIGGCSIYSGCLDFCANSCLQIVRFLTDASVPEGVEMVVTTSNGNQIRVERDIRGDETQIPHFFSIYVVALPADSIEISFIGSDGYTIVYPSFAVPVLEAPPECSNHLVVEDITIVRPLSGRDTCDDLIFNGDFDTGVSGWQGLNAGNTWSSQGGAEGTGALVTESRTNVLLNNPSQWIDTSCVEAGNTYILHLEYRNVNFAVPCQGIGLDCPNAQLVFSDFDPYTGEFVESLPRRVFETTESSPNGFTFSAIVDAWTPTAEEASSDRVQLQVTRGSGNIMIDNVHMRRMWGGNQILNGDFAAGSIDGVWHGFGNDIAIVQPGYNGYEGFALEATRNQGSANGMYQNVYNKYVNSETDLIKEGDEWLLSFHVRLFDGTTGNAIDCVPSLMDTTCPMVWVHTIHGETIPDGDQSVDQLFFDPEMSWDPNDWNTFETIITISEEDAADDLILYRLILNGGPVGAKLVVDDVSFTKRLRKIPSRLDFCGVNHITNGEFETGTTTGFYGWGNPIASYDPGYEGAGDFALAAIRPNHYSNGMWQDLFNSYKNPDNLQLCAQPGDVYRVKFKTRLLDATGQIGLACDPSLGDTNCPMVWVHTIRGVDLASGEQNIMEVFDTEMAWDANSWNSFDTTFTITEAQTGSNLLLFRIIFNGGPVGAQLVNDEIEVFMETLAPV